MFVMDGKKKSWSAGEKLSLYKGIEKKVGKTAFLT
jgi:hypothetical protein